MEVVYNSQSNTIVFQCRKGVSENVIHLSANDVIFVVDENGIWKIIINLNGNIKLNINGVKVVQ